MLDKLFCDINKSFSIRFTLNHTHPQSLDGMTIRAMLVYTAAGEMANPVIRCKNHQTPEDPINQKIFNAHQLDHVIWSNSNDAFYDRNACSGRLSVITPFGHPHLGSNYVAQVYKFTCIGSCAGGINRRATTLLFTLEQHGQILGRQSLSCRICSCPKRDRKGQESALLKQSLMNQVELDHPQQSVVPKKKLKLSSSPMKGVPNQNDHIYTVPVYGYENYMALMKFAEYLDSTSGALKNSHYQIQRAQILMEQPSKSNDKPREYPELDI